MQRALGLVIGDAQTLVTMRDALGKDMDEHQAKIKAIVTMPAPSRVATARVVS